MQRKLFRPADILLPAECNMQLWSVVACDQFSSDPAYWDTVGEMTEGKPSTMHMILPEAYLDVVDEKAVSRQINETMAQYLDTGMFRTLKDSYIYVERTLPDGVLRRGLMGVIDLMYYDYHEGSATPVRATEHTVESRLPPRVEIRRNAPLEMPHIMLFIDDRDNKVMSCAAEHADEPVYDFELMCGGGHIVGRAISDESAVAVSEMLDALTDKALLEEKYGFSDGAIIYAIGDGNHSLAAAKNCWEALRVGLSEEEQEDHPARFALVELMNIHDEGVTFHPIHRAVFGVDAAAFIHSAEEELFSENGTAVTLVTEQGISECYVHADSIGQVIERVDHFCQCFAAEHKGQVDYIHGDREAMEFGSAKNNGAILLPAMKKEELFTSVMETGVFCKKSFSIGEAVEKRYYLECRAIR